ncbi:bifunctional glutamate/proline tRNA-synthetase [Tupanvirus deep ocean]|uniref:Bifunctional glutamate/proline tRNA-synthetase n=2 Tax=Tupanvirus TaxID=2094720 RepID=A0AC62A816_9VIRU|nr:bifunctional glutamate/proline tRNA-synthetase [Tupanvirus deep ocean]QKU33926.1 bifunctional glutamate/proline tRNA-synthetase [Tupanvirus deep ocean]
MAEKDRTLPKLRNAEIGKVVTRFPPEASGYLHLGHIKALLLNYLYAKEYNGKIILRFDDTNPEKENAAYEKAILEDIKNLGLECDEITYASDWFDKIMVFAYSLISKGLAYVDFSTAEEINEDRIKLRESKYRNTDVDINYDFFMRMQIGKMTNCCLRAKINHASKNGCMRDPVIYRCKNQIHPRQGTTYKIFPTYDFACPILDALQGVTHAMRSIEYKDRDSQYEWFLEKLSLKHNGYPMILDYGKLNFTNTVLSKRKLKKLVDAELVSGWDDPRMPTFRGIIRKGIRVHPLLKYIKTQAASRNVVLLTWEKLWSFNSSHLDVTSRRLYGLVKSNIKTVYLSGVVPHNIELANHPKDHSFGKRNVLMATNILVESDDFDNVKIGDRYTLIGLGNAVVTSLDPLVLDYNENDNDYKNTIKITWLPDNKNNINVKVKFFDHLLTKPKLEDEDDIIKCFNQNSLTEKEYLVEPSILEIPKGSVFQIMRKHYCYMDSNDKDIVLHAVPV